MTSTLTFLRTGASFIALSVLIHSTCLAQKTPTRGDSNGGMVEKALGEAEDLIDRKDYKNAQANIDIARTGMTVLADARKEELLANLNYLQGIIEEKVGKRETAKGYYKESFIHAGKAEVSRNDKHELIAKAKIAYAKLEVETASFSNAATIGEQAFESFEKVSNYKGQIESLMLVGSSKLRNYDRVGALTAFEKAITLYKEHPTSQNDYVALLINVADIARQQGFSNKALDYLNEALIIADSRGERALVADVQATLTTVLASLNRYDEAADACSKALSYYQSHNSPSTAPTLQKMAKLFTGLRTAASSASYFAEVFGGKAPSVSAESADLEGLVTNNTNRKPNLTFGLACYNRSSKLIKSGDVATQIENLLGRGKIYLEANNIPKAKADYDAAYALIKPRYPSKHPYVAECLLALGKIRLVQKDIEGSLELISQSLNSSMEDGAEVSGKSAPDLNKAKYPYELLSAINTQGDAFSAGFDENSSVDQLTDAMNSYATASKLLNKLRRTHRSQGQRYELAKTAKLLGTHAVATAYKLYKKTGDKKYVALAYDYAESTKASNLLEALRDLEARRIAGVSIELLEKERAAKVEMSYLDEDIFNELRKGDKRNEQQLADMQAKKLELNQEYDGILKEIEQKYPAYYNLKYKYDTTPLDVVQSNLRADEVMIEYLIADSTLYIFTVDKGSADVVTVNFTGRLLSKVIPFMVSLKTSDYALFIPHTRYLYNTLIAPVADRLKGKKNIMVIPDAELNYISYELLVEKDPAADDGNFATLDYLMKKQTFCYNYSASLYVQSRQMDLELNPSNGFLGMAPDFKRLDYGVIRSRLAKAEDTSSVFADLPGARDEVAQIGSQVKGETFIAEKATEIAFKQNVSKYGVLHIATHTVIDNNNPLYSKLVLLGDKNTSDDDGLLNTYELFDLKLNAGLATLSACNSGIGIIEDGEGVMSIARGFSFAGCPNVVMSLWPVPDNSTSNIMKSFYKYLLEGKPKAEALRQAKLDYLETANRMTSSPFYWGGFVIVGNPDELNLEQLKLKSGSSKMIWWLGGGLLALLLIGGGVAATRKKAA